MPGQEGRSPVCRLPNVRLVVSRYGIVVTGLEKIQNTEIQKNDECNDWISVTDFGGIFCLNVYKKLILLYVCLKSLSHRLWIFESLDGLIMLTRGSMRAPIGADISYSNCSFARLHCLILLTAIVIWGRLRLDETYCLSGLERPCGLVITYYWSGSERAHGLDDTYMYCGSWSGRAYGLIDITVYCGSIWIWAHLRHNDTYFGFGFKLSVFMAWWYLLLVWI